MRAERWQRKQNVSEGRSEGRSDDGRSDGGGGIWRLQTVQARNERSAMCVLIMLSANVWVRQARLKTTFFGHS